MANIKSLNMTIAGKTLSDKFTVQTYDAAAIDQVFTVAIKDFNYTFKANDISSINNLATVSGIYDIDDILNKGIHNLFNPPINATDVRAVNTMQAIASLLGKTLNINITDFYPADFPITPTGKELISALFGWTDKIPQRQINVFIRGNVINVLERGKESGMIEVTTYAYSSSMPPAYLMSKKTITTTTTGTPPVTTYGAINVAYSYNNEKLVKEVEEHYTGDALDMKRITRHYPLGQGMWGTSIVEDDITTYGGISQGAPGGKANGYSIAKESASPSTPEIPRVPPTYILPGKPYTKYLGTMPVTDIATITRIANEIIWLDKKTEVKVTLDAYADTIFDLTKKILWQGDEYYLESNNVNVDPDKTLQRLELIRWG